MRVHVEDGRAFLRRNPNQRWDAIILDAFSIGGRLPFHLMTQEFLATVKARLNPDGVVLANLPSALAGEGGEHLPRRVPDLRESLSRRLRVPAPRPRGSGCGQPGMVVTHP